VTDLPDPSFGAFLVGATLGSAITYLIVTHEKRIVTRVRHCVDHFALEHELAQHEYEKARFPYNESRRQTIYPGTIGSDEEILALYNWAKKLRDDPMMNSSVKKKLRNPIALAAEALICRELLGLEPADAVRAFYHCDGTLEDMARLVGQWSSSVRSKARHD
jgi:hypothetical protein